MVSQRQKEKISEYVKNGYSANKIQAKLRELNIGLRRKTLLAEVRRFKGQVPKTETVKYIPKKYAKVKRVART